MWQWRWWLMAHSNLRQASGWVLRRLHGFAEGQPLAFLVRDHLGKPVLVKEVGWFSWFSDGSSPWQQWDGPCVNASTLPPLLLANHPLGRVLQQLSQLQPSRSIFTKRKRFQLFGPNINRHIRIIIGLGLDVHWGRPWSIKRRRKSETRLGQGLRGHIGKCCKTADTDAAIVVYLCTQRLSKAILSSFCCNFNQNICIILYLHILPQLVVLKFFPVLYFGNMY